MDLLSLDSGNDDLWNSDNISQIAEDFSISKDNTPAYVPLQINKSEIKHP